MEDLTALQDRYAELAIRTGLNVQPGQAIILQAPIEVAGFVHLLAHHAYAAGARHVHVLWDDPLLARIHLGEAPAEALHEFPRWQAAWFEDVLAGGGARLRVAAPHPGVLDGIDAARVAAWTRAEQQAMRRSMQMVSRMDVNWLVIGVPTRAWADRALADVPADQRIEALWRDIFRAVRADQADPVAAWQAHARQLERRAAALEAHRFRRLRYRASGTDLRVGLPDGHLWCRPTEHRGGDGLPFIPNMPTEEVFTAPLCTDVEGQVRGTMPLVYRDTLIEGLQIRFSGGRIVSFEASAGRDAFAALIDTDAGARRLGEVALVPADSPVASLGRLFYNTLFDENASCHLAIGRAYAVCVEGGRDLDAEGLAARGLNSSDTHVDFMIGSRDLDIDGETADGHVVPVFRDGVWAEGL